MFYLNHLKCAPGRPGSTKHKPNGAKKCEERVGENKAAVHKQVLLGVGLVLVRRRSDEQTVKFGFNRELQLLSKRYRLTLASLTGRAELLTTTSSSTPSMTSTTTKIFFALAGSRSPGPVACKFIECIAIPCSADRFTASLPPLRVLELALHFSTLPCLFFGSPMPTWPAALASACSHLSFFVCVSTARRACRAA